MSEPEFQALKLLTGMLGEYRGVTGRIVERYDRRNPYILVSDRAQLAHLNETIDEVVKGLRARIAESEQAQQ